MINQLTSISFNKNNRGPVFKSSLEESKADRPVASENHAAVPVPTLVAYMNNICKPQNLQISYFNIPEETFAQMLQKYAKLAQQAASELQTREHEPNQELSWIEELPQTQLKRVDEIYSLADSLKNNEGKETGKLGIIGIGGSKHTIENMLSLFGLLDKAVFLSSVTPEDEEAFLKKLGDKSKAAVMVASKSGTTLEPSCDFEYVRKVLGDDFKNYVCITDKDENKSKLRKLANEKGYKCGIIHDGCGGRFGAFDDHTLVALAYCGLPKEDMKKLLSSSIKAQKNFLNPDINSNPALQRAAFNTRCVISGKTNQYDYYFGDRFEGAALWNTQLKKESHKSLYKASGDLIGPAFLHNSTESDLDEGNINSFYTFNAVKNNNSAGYKAYNALLNGSLTAYKERHPVSLLQLKELSPEAIAEFVELKHFETIYTGMFLRSLQNANNKPDITHALPEVLQPHVNIYKKEVNKILNS